MQIKTIYYGIFREKTKCHEEIVNTETKNIGEFYDELKNKYKFELNINEVLIAVNDEYHNDLSYVMKDNDLVVFLHPMSGG